MADGAKFSLNGLEGVLGKLEAVKKDVRLKGGRFAARKAAQVIERHAKDNAQRFDDPATAEKIADNVAVRFSSQRFKRTGDLMFRVGVLGGARQYADTRENRRADKVGVQYATLGDKGNPGGDTYYWRFLEFGTETVPAIPFLRSAAREAEQESLSVFVSEYDKALERAIRRGQKKLSKPP